MALSRLRHTLVINRVSSFYNLRILSTRTISGCSGRLLLSRDSNVLDTDEVFPRHVSSLLMSKPPNGYSTLQLGVRHFSSGDSPPHTVIGMPALSPTMTQGNIATWKKKEGDKVSNSTMVKLARVTLLDV